MGGEKIEFKRGRRIQFLCYDRKGMDGDMERVWVRGIMVKKEDDEYVIVKHISWEEEEEGEFKEVRVYANQIREDNVNDDIYDY